MLSLKFKKSEIKKQKLPLTPEFGDDQKLNNSRSETQTETEIVALHPQI